MEELAEPPVLVAVQLEVLGLHLGLVEDSVESLYQRQQAGYDLLLALVGDETGVMLEDRLSRMGGNRAGLAGADIDSLLKQQRLSRLEGLVGIEEAVDLGGLAENGVDSSRQQVEAL